MCTWLNRGASGGLAGASRNEIPLNTKKTKGTTIVKSAESPLTGKPFNIASYALLTMMLAQQCDLDLGDFIWTGGDCHIYANHLDQTALQLSREPFSYPDMRILRRPASIFDYHYEDFELQGYKCHPHIAGKVSK